MSTQSMVLSLLLLMAAVAAGKLGVDSSTAYSGTQYSCMREHGFSLAAAEGFCGKHLVNTEVVASAAAAHKAGLDYDLYFFPCTKSCPTLSAAAQVETLLNYTKAHGVNFTRLWLDIEQPSGWDSDKEKNIRFIEGMRDAAVKGLGVRRVGVYTEESVFHGIVPTTYTGLKELLLWYANVDGHASFAGFKPFAGWTKPSMKQYAIEQSKPIQGTISGFYANGTAQVIVAEQLSPTHLAGSGQSTLFWTTQRQVLWWDQSAAQLPSVVFTAANTDITDIASFGDTTLFVVSGSALTVVDVSAPSHPQIIYNHSSALTDNARGAAISASRFAYVDPSKASKLFVFDFKTGTTTAYASPCFCNYLLVVNNKLLPRCGVLCTDSSGFYPLVGDIAHLPSTFVSWGHIAERSTAVAFSRYTTFVVSSDGVHSVDQQSAPYKTWNSDLFFDFILVE